MIKLLCMGLLVASFSDVWAGSIVLDSVPDPVHPEDVVWSDSDPSDDDACTITFAAKELQQYLRLITGHDEDWTIVDAEHANAEQRVVLTKLKNTEAINSLGREGYHLETSNTGTGWQVEIKAAHRIGLLYGAYDVLHRFGVRWFSPGETGQLVPRSDLETVPVIKTTEKPDFLLRGFHAWENRGGPDFLLWMARNRLNYWCVNERDKSMLSKLGIQLAGGEHLIHDWYLGGKRPYPYNHPDFDGDEDLPPDPYGVSSFYKGDPDKNGRLSYFEAHPEWFGLHQGKRIPGPRATTGSGVRHGVNFCTSNQDARTEFVKNAVKDLESGRLKDAAVVNAWLLDNATWCACEPCHKLGSPTDRNLLVMHAYDRGIKEAQKAGRINREVRLLFLTYNDVIAPPTRPLPDDFDYSTCIATFFPIRRCYVHDLQDAGCDINSRFNGIFKGWISSLDRHYRGQMCIGEYYNVSRFKCLPMSFMGTMTPDIPYYHKLGARYFHYMHVSTKNWGNKALTNWQMSRQLWDVGTDVEGLWQDYFASRYGKAAGDMRRFYETLEPMLSNITLLKYKTGPAMGNGGKNAFDGSSHLSYETPGVAPCLLEMREAGTTCREVIDSVLKRALPESVLERIQEDERMFAYGEKTLEFYDLAEQGFRAVRQHEPEKAKRALARLEEISRELSVDTVSAAFAGEHASSPNTLDATYGRNAPQALREQIQKMEP